MFTAVMHMAAGEHALRHDSKEKVKEARSNSPRRARHCGRVHSPAQRALCRTRRRLPGARAAPSRKPAIRSASAGCRTRTCGPGPTKSVFTVFEELEQVLGLVAAADLEFRTYLARRLTRELAAARAAGAGQSILVPLRAVHSAASRPKARRVVALETLPRGQGFGTGAAGRPKELKSRGAELTKSPAAGFRADALPDTEAWTKAPASRRRHPPGGAVLDASRYAYTGLPPSRAKPTRRSPSRGATAGRSSRCGRLTPVCRLGRRPGSGAGHGLRRSSPRTSKKDVTISPYSVLRLCADRRARPGSTSRRSSSPTCLPDESAKAWAQATRCASGWPPHEGEGRRGVGRVARRSEEVPGRARVGPDVDGPAEHARFRRP